MKPHENVTCRKLLSLALAMSATYYLSFQCFQCALASSLAASDPNRPLISPLIRPLIIAHRGASGILPEHTLVAYAAAHAAGADYIEPDVVLSKDGVPILLHDIHLEATTDVAKVFPGRARKDGRYYAIDFRFEELQKLRVSERGRPKSRGTWQQVYPKRFPRPSGADAAASPHGLNLRIPTLAALITLVQGMNISTGREAGIYPEIKAPAFHRKEGYDISKAVIATLAEFGYSKASDKAILQCFDAQELKRLKTDLKTELRLVQLIGENSWQIAATDYEAMKTQSGLKAVAEYAHGIGPWLPQVVTWNASGQAQWSELMEQAKKAKLFVHAYTLRRDSLPKHVPSFAHLIGALQSAPVRLDGVFTDFPSETLSIFNELSRKAGLQERKAPR